MVRIEIDLDAKDDRCEFRTVRESTTPRKQLVLETKMARIIKNNVWNVIELARKLKEGKFEDVKEHKEKETN